MDSATAVRVLKQDLPAGWEDSWKQFLEQLQEPAQLPDPEVEGSGMWGCNTELADNASSLLENDGACYNELKRLLPAYHVALSKLLSANPSELMFRQVSCSWLGLREEVHNMLHKVMLEALQWYEGEVTVTDWLELLFFTWRHTKYMLREQP